MDKFFAKAFSALLLLLFLSNASALNLSMNEILISVDKEGYAAITENYYLDFDLAGDENKFKTKLQENQTSLSAWHADYGFISPKFRIENENDLSNSNIAWDEKNNVFTLDYSLKKPIVRSIESKPRADSWEIPETAFKNFISQGLVEIPENVKIIFMLPPNAAIDLEKITPYAKTENNTVTLNGIRTNSIGLGYSIPKPIAQDTNSGMIEEILSDPSMVFLIIVICLLLLGGIYWKRRKIESIAEEFIVNNSQMERKEIEETEIDFE